MAYRLPPMSALRQFEAAARHLNFRKAAEELHLTASAVSHAVNNLEQWLGTELFIRSPKGLRLTKAGETMLPGIQTGLAAIESSASGVKEREDKERIRLSVAPTFANFWLIPRLSLFREQYPGINVVVDTSHVQRDLISDGIDAAIRMGTGEWNGLESQLLFQESLVPVCSPELAALIGSDTSLADFDLLNVTTVSDDWSWWNTHSGAPFPQSSRCCDFDSVQTAWNAAIHSLGIALGRLPLVESLLEQGKLVALAHEPIRSETSYWLITRAQAPNHPTIQCFCDWIRQELGVLD